MIWDFLIFHKLVITSFRFKHNPGAPKVVFYRSYKHFKKAAFEKELFESVANTQNYTTFDDRFLNVLNKHAPVKQKTLRANNAPYMTKALRKAMMESTELATKYHKTRNLEDYERFRKHRNYVSRLYKKERKQYFNNLDKNEIQDVKKFWKSMKNLISDKCKTQNSILLVKGEEIITKDSEVEI